MGDVEVIDTILEFSNFKESGFEDIYEKSDLIKANIYLDNDVPGVPDLCIDFDKGERFKRRYATLIIDYSNLSEIYRMLKEVFED